MRRLRQTLPSLRSDDGGFTLVELIITIFVLGVVVAPVSAILIFNLRNSGATVARMNESHDAQLAASYFAEDVQAVGVRGAYTSTTQPSFLQSIETTVTATGGLYPCGTAGEAVVRFAWDDFSDATPTSRTQKRVAYVVDGTELHRIECANSAAIITDLTLADRLVPLSVTITCADESGTDMSCTGSTLPATVAMSLIIHDPDSGDDDPPYEIQLTGQRRQS